MTTIEEKWINNQITHGTYEKWYTDLSSVKYNLKSQIENLNKDEEEIHKLLNYNLDRLTDLRAVYEEATTLQKHGLIKTGFDCNLYYKNGLYRTPTMLKPLQRNVLAMKQKVC